MLKLAIFFPPFVTLAENLLHIVIVLSSATEKHDQIEDDMLAHFCSLSDTFSATEK